MPSQEISTRDENENKNEIDSDQTPEPEEQVTIQSPRPKIFKNIQFKEGAIQNYKLAK